jgi:hypothetical protein
MLEMGIKSALWLHHAAFNFGDSFMACSGMDLLQIEQFHLFDPLSRFRLTTPNLRELDYNDTEPSGGDKRFGKTDETPIPFIALSAVGSMGLPRRRVGRHAIG